MVFFVLQRDKGESLPPPSRLKRKILIKNKRLHPDVEARELEEFKKGNLMIEEVSDTADTTGGAATTTNSATDDQQVSISNKYTLISVEW